MFSNLTAEKRWHCGTARFAPKRTCDMVIIASSDFVMFVKALVGYYPIPMEI